MRLNRLGHRAEGARRLVQAIQERGIILGDGCRIGLRRDGRVQQRDGVRLLRQGGVLGEDDLFQFQLFELLLQRQDLLGQLRRRIGGLRQSLLAGQQVDLRLYRPLRGGVEFAVEPHGVGARLHLQLELLLQCLRRPLGRLRGRKLG